MSHCEVSAYGGDRTGHSQRRRYLSSQWSQIRPLHSEDFGKAGASAAGRLPERVLSGAVGFSILIVYLISSSAGTKVEGSTTG